MNGIYERDFFAKQEYMREAYGDPCPIHQVLRWGADCPICEQEAYEEMYQEGLI